MHLSYLYIGNVMLKMVIMCYSTSSMACHNSESSYLSKGSKLQRMVPEKSCGSCGMIEMHCRRSWSPISWTRIPSIQMSPVGSVILKRAETRELFPAPVRPTIPIFSCGLTSNEMSRRTGLSPSSPYERETEENLSSPFCGQSELGLDSGGQVICIFQGRRD